mmetsp:Transcript_148346/g.474814  ORF Transcript_148346/g.474814 Transcript_148346/m.474814 type:complete len:217 (+) Transcript_148346:169-819(+)
MEAERDWWISKLVTSGACRNCNQGHPPIKDSPKTTHATQKQTFSPATHVHANIVFKFSATLNSKPVAALTASSVVSGAISIKVGGTSGPVVTKSKTPSSVMHLLTTRAPVRGRPQDCFNLCLPPLAVCSMTTSTRESDETRSMAPPMPFTILPGMIQFAKSPFAATSMAPRIVMSTCPPLIIAKESAEEKVEEPGIIVMVSLPALMRSGSTSASMG